MCLTLPAIAFETFLIAAEPSLAMKTTATVKLTKAVACCSVRLIYLLCSFLAPISTTLANCSPMYSPTTWLRHSPFISCITAFTPPIPVNDCKPIEAAFSAKRAE